MRPSFGFVLRAVAAEEPTVSRLAELLGVTKQAASRLVDDATAAYSRPAGISRPSNSRQPTTVNRPPSPRPVTQPRRSPDTPGWFIAGWGAEPAFAYPRAARAARVIRGAADLGPGRRLRRRGGAGRRRPGGVDLRWCRAVPAGSGLAAGRRQRRVPHAVRAGGRRGYRDRRRAAQALPSWQVVASNRPGGHLLTTETRVLAIGVAIGIPVAARLGPLNPGTSTWRLSSARRFAASP